MGNVFVNATAAEIGGLYTIVDQFIQSINSNDKTNKYYIFVSNKKFNKYNSSQIKVINVSNKGWIKRFIWDSIGIKKWSKNHGIIPKVVVSLQNTPVRFNKVSQIVYLHTPIPFVDYKWDPLKKDQRKMWFYKNIYPFFIKSYLNKDCEMVVQAEWLKKSLIKKIPKLKESKITVIRPDIAIEKLKENVSDKKNLKTNKKTLFYPSIDYIYKNHVIILKALAELKMNDKSLGEKVNVIFTVGKDSWLYKESIKLDVTDCVSFEGQMEYNTVLSKYSQADAILFPSYIETFGLPLIEAATFGKYILCADEEYSREVLDNQYQGVKFTDTMKEREWAINIKEVLYKNTENYSFNYFTEEGNWVEFFELIKEERTIR